MRSTDDDDRLPDALRGAFARLHGGSVPQEVEQAVMAHAHGHWMRRRRRRFTVTVGAALAAATVLVSTFIVFAPLPEESVLQTVRTEDLDGSGRVDILDAFALARSVAQGSRADAALDFTHDGRVDRADVDHVAQMAVRLGS